MANGWEAEDARELGELQKAALPVRPAGHDGRSANREQSPPRMLLRPSKRTRQQPLDHWPSLGPTAKAA